MIGECNQHMVEVPFEQTWNTPKELDPYLVRIQQEVFDLVKNSA